MNRTVVTEDADVLLAGLPKRPTAADLISDARSAEDGFRADEENGSHPYDRRASAAAASAANDIAPPAEWEKEMSYADMG